jgi:hypothetical protein
MSTEEENFAEWGQGDASLDVDALPHVNAENEIIDLRVAGVVITSQTCDIVNGSSLPGSPALIQVAGLVEQNARFVEEVRKFRRPRYLYVPALSHRNLVADLELTATYDRAVLSKWTRVPAPQDRESRSHCSFALGRQRARHAFPDLWATAFDKLRDWIKARAGKDSDEGRFVDAIEELRVVADDVDRPPSIDIICIMPVTATPSQRAAWAATMIPLMTGKLDKAWCPNVVVRLATTRELTAEEYLSARPLDFEAMSRAANDDAPIAGRPPKAETGADAQPESTGPGTHRKF